MLIEIFQHLFRFILLVFIQVLVLNKIEIGGILNGYFNPFLYIMFILMLPVNINKVLLLFIAFLTGLTIDIFSGTPGMHASACLVLAFIRPGFLNLIAPREGYETTLRLNISGMGVRTFVVYAGVCTLVHHTVLFFIEAFNFVDILNLLLRIVTNSFSSFALIMLSQVLSQRTKDSTL
ncbi:MAG: rod shape-determining protein MreD [Bacteroidia bacterium]|nr:rod shape-determining protein MreD [Bacteroidia bacterium]MCC6768495.1 rod shape-determining protein MreD [Bacteroidia bacterium]